MSEEKKTIQIRSELYEAVRRKAESDPHKFGSVEEYVEYLLKKMLEEESTENVYTPEEEKKVEKHLKDMGYI
ncbi:hypothetical protein ACFLQ6_03630 [Thermoproteota archaeon]